MARLLKKGVEGADVRAMKEALLTLGYYDPRIRRITKDAFGNDTLEAVRAFQRANTDTERNPLAVDGVIGSKTRGAILSALAAKSTISIPDNIGSAAAAAILPSLAALTATRRDLVLEALSYAYDPEAPREYPISLYIRGGNLYNTNLTKNVITAARIEAGARLQPQYYSGGRREMMLEAIEKTPATTGADCSGGIVGLLRKYGLEKPGFDQTANALCSTKYSAPIARAALRPGDWVGRSGHIGVYAGGGYVVEWVGGAYGCQLTALANRRAYDFVAKRLRTKSAWTRFRRPRSY